MSLLLEMFTYPFIVRAFVVGILVSRVRGASGGSPGAQAVLHDRRRAEPRVLRGAVGRGGLRVGAAAGVHPGGGHLAALGLLRMTERSRMRGRRRHRGGVRLGAGHRHHRHQPYHRHDHGRGQLYVRLHPGHEPGGCGLERRCCPRRFWCCSCCFTTSCSPSPLTRASPGPRA